MAWEWLVGPVPDDATGLVDDGGLSQDDRLVSPPVPEEGHSPVALDQRDVWPHPGVLGRGLHERREFGILKGGIDRDCRRKLRAAALSDDARVEPHRDRLDIGVV